jgi:hypothetical protein
VTSRPVHIHAEQNHLRDLHRPAKLFGCRTSPSTANSNTITPPAKKRITSCIIGVESQSYPGACAYRRSRVLSKRPIRLVRGAQPENRVVHNARNASAPMEGGTSWHSRDRINRF